MNEIIETLIILISTIILLIFGTWTLLNPIINKLGFFEIIIPMIIFIILFLTWFWIVSKFLVFKKIMSNFINKKEAKEQ